MDEAQRQKLTEWITRKHGGPLVCPVCRAEEWDYRTLHLQGAQGETRVSYETWCQNCGYMLLFSQRVLGRL